MKPIDLYRQALTALEMEPSYPNLPWSGPQAKIRTAARIALKQAIAELGAVPVYLEHRGGSTWFCPRCEGYLTAACPCCEPQRCACGAGARPVQVPVELGVPFPPQPPVSEVPAGLSRVVR